MLRWKSRMFDEETTLLPSLRGSEAAQLVGKAAEGEEERIAEVLAALDPGTSEEDKERVTKVGQSWYMCRTDSLL